MWNEILSKLSRIKKVLTKNVRKSAVRPFHFKPQVEVLPPRIAPAVYDWRPANNDALWSDAENWRVGIDTPDTAPGMYDTARFSNANTNNAKIDVDYGGILGALQIDQGYTGTISVGRDVLISSYTQKDGTVTAAAGGGSNNIYVDGDGTWEGGTLGGTANPDTSTLTVLNGATFSIPASKTVALAGRVLYNWGTIAIDSMAGAADTIINMSNGGAINNDAGGTFQATGTGVVKLTGSGGAFFNSALVRSDNQAQLTIDVPVSHYAGTWLAGVGAVRQAHIDFNGSASFFGGAPAANQVATLDGLGIIHFDNNLTIAADTTSSVRDLESTGPLYVNQSVQFSINAGFGSFDGASVISGTLLFATGTNGGFGGDLITVTSTGSVVNFGTLAFMSSWQIDGSLENNLEIDWVRNDITVGSGGVIRNATLFSLTDPPLVQMQNPNKTLGGAGRFDNNGRFELSVGATTVLTVSANFNNYNRVDADEGLMVFTQDWIQPAATTNNAGTLNLYAGRARFNNFTNLGTVGVYENTSIEADNVFNYGTLAFNQDPNTVRLDIQRRPNAPTGGNFTQGSSGTLRMNLLAAGGSDLLQVAGRASLAGHLEVRSMDTSFPAVDDWALVLASQVVGEFDSSDIIDDQFVQIPVYAANAVAMTNNLGVAVAMASSLNPAFLSQQVTLTATVTPAAGLPLGLATGWVFFYDDDTFIGQAYLDENGLATLDTSSLCVGTHSLTAVYQGDGVFEASTSDALIQTVNANATAVSLSSDLNASYYSQQVNLSATVVPSGTPVVGPATGWVNFYDNDIWIGQAYLDGTGVATLAISSLGAGTHSLTAVYQGDGVFDGSTSDALTQTVNANASSTALSSSAASNYYGTSVTFIATVTPNGTPITGPTGWVNFFDNDNWIGQAYLDANGAASLDLSDLSVGDHVITARYEGDGVFELSLSDPLCYTVL